MATNNNSFDNDKATWKSILQASLKNKKKDQGEDEVDLVGHRLCDEMDFNAKGQVHSEKHEVIKKFEGTKLKIKKPLKAGDNVSSLSTKK